MRSSREYKRFLFFYRARMIFLVFWLPSSRCLWQLIVSSLEERFVLRGSKVNNMFLWSVSILSKCLFCFFWGKYQLGTTTIEPLEINCAKILCIMKCMVIRWIVKKFGCLQINHHASAGEFVVYKQVLSITKVELDLVYVPNTKCPTHPNYKPNKENSTFKTPLSFSIQNIVRKSSIKAGE